MKTRQFKVSSRHREQMHGMSLIEIMVSLTIGMVVLIAIGFAFVNSTNLNRQRDGQSELNEPARVVLRQLRNSIGSAGYVDIFDVGGGNGYQAQSLFSVATNTNVANVFQRVPTGGTALATPLSQIVPGLLPIFGCEGAMNGSPNAIATSSPTTLLPVTLGCGAADPISHTLQVAFQGVPSLTAVNAPRSLLPDNATTGDGRDCLQQTPPGKFIINKFFIKLNAKDGVKELMCEGSGSTSAQAIARGVEELVLRYAVTAPGAAAPAGSVPPSTGDNPARYLSANGVTLDPTNVPVGVGWPGVTAVEVCFIFATPQYAGSAANDVSILQTVRPTCTRTAAGAFDPDIARVAGDRRLWKRFTAILAVRNSAFSTPY
jgi:type IV pilus assembly protein PilW